MTENVQRTLIILKPDAVQRAIVGELIARFERRGLRLAAMRLAKVDRALAEKHYEVHKGKFFYEDLVKTISAAPVVAAVLEGPNAIAVVRAMVGATRPHEPRRARSAVTTHSSGSATSSTRAMRPRPPRRRSRSGSP